MELFGFLQSELAKESDAAGKVSQLYENATLGVFSREMWLRLGVAPPANIAPFDDTAWFPAPSTLVWKALEAVVRDDMPLLYFLLSKDLIDLSLKTPSFHVDFPYMATGDSLVKFADRFNSFWCKLLLLFWRLRKAKGGPAGEADERRLSRTVHSKVHSVHVLFFLFLRLSFEDCATFSSRKLCHYEA
jgi:hypothetical protein